MAREASSQRFGAWDLGPARNRFARLFPLLATIALTAALVAVTLGGVVRVTDSDLGCPDWPLCQGRIIPPPNAASWIEYIHRLGAATTTVFISLMLLSGLARYGVRDRRALLIALPPLLLATQATLGALTVLLEVPPVVAAAHMGTAVALVGSLALVVVNTRAPSLRATSMPARLPVRYGKLVAGLSAVAFLVVLSGAYATWSDASLSCPSFPACGAPIGRVQVIQMLHRVGALLVSALMLWTLWETWRLKPKESGLRLLAVGATTVLAAQVGFGISNVLLQLPEWSRGGHVVFATLFFATTVLLTGNAWKSSFGGKTAGSTVPAIEMRIR